MNLKKSILLLFFIIILSSFVAAQETTDIFRDTFSAIVPEDFSFADLYDDYGMFIDLIVYLILFIGVAHATLMKKFEGTGGKTVVVVVGIMLAVGLAAWAHQEVDGEPRFMLINLGPIAGALFALIIFSTVYTFTKGIMGNHGMGDKATAGLVAWIFIYYAMVSVFPAVFKFLYSVPVIGPFFGIFTNLAVIVAIFMVVKRFGKGLNIFGRKSTADTGDLDKGFEETQEAIEKAEEATEEAVDETEDDKKELDKTEDKQTGVEQKMFKTLDEFYRLLIDLKKGEDVKEDLKGIKDVLIKLTDELKQLKELEGIECKIDETMLERIKTPGEKEIKNYKIKELLTREKSFLLTFELLLRRAINNYYRTGKNGGIDHAAQCIEQARRVLQELIFINELQKKQN